MIDENGDLMKAEPVKFDADCIGTHASHCCKQHGCKYGDENCPVEHGVVEQQYPCESCDYEEKYRNEALDAAWDRISKDIHMFDYPRFSWEELRRKLYGGSR